VITRLVGGGVGSVRAFGVSGDGNVDGDAGLVGGGVVWTTGAAAKVGSFVLVTTCDFCWYRLGIGKLDASGAVAKLA